MEYKKIQDTIFVRMDPGDEVVSGLQKIAETEHILLAEVHGLGALNRLTVGVWQLDSKTFRPNCFEGAYEVTSLTGTITEQDGAPYLHLHMSAGDADGNVVGGHLTEAVVSATAEITVRLLDGHVGRQYDSVTGLNLFSF